MGLDLTEIGANFAAPTAMVRCAMFSSMTFRGDAERFVAAPKARVELFAVNGILVYQTGGAQLDQADADVFYELLRRVVTTKAGALASETWLSARLSELVKSLGRAKGGKSNALTLSSLMRLMGAQFEITVPGRPTVFTRLILKMRESKAKAGVVYEVLLDLELASLLNGDQWVLLRRAERDKLKGDPVARSMHAYYSSHSNPHPLLPSTLQKLTGRMSRRDKDWHKDLVDAMALMSEVTPYRYEIAKSGSHAGCVVRLPKVAKPAKAEKAPAQKPRAPSYNAETLEYLGTLSERDLRYLSMCKLNESGINKLETQYGLPMYEWTTVELLRAATTFWGHFPSAEAKARLAKREAALAEDI